MAQLSQGISKTFILSNFATWVMHKKYYNHWNLTEVKEDQEKNSIFAAYCSYSVVYVCNSTEITGLGHAIFKFMSAVTYLR